MPSVTVIRNGVTSPGAPVMTVQQDGGPVVSMISSPPQTHGSAAVWSLSEHNRPGKSPLLISSAPGLRGGSFDHWIRHANPYESVETEIAALRAVAESGIRVRFTGGGLLLGGSWWEVEAFEVEEEEKGRNGMISRAKLSWTVKQATTTPGVKLTTTPGTPDASATRPDVVPAEPVREPSTTTPAGNTTDPTKPFMPF